MAQYPAIIDVSTLNGTNGFKLEGEANSDLSGFSVASAGDVNGDGFADVIVGAPFADPHGDRPGASYVVFGGASGFAAAINLSSLDGSNGFKLSGVGGADDSGRSVASAGDLNGDGCADLIVGARGADPHGASSGASYVVFGHASGFTANLDLSALDGSNGFKLSGEASRDSSGDSVASAGDVNGDGFQDIIIGAHRANQDSYYSAGASYVVFGNVSGFPANLDLSSLDGSNGFKVNGRPQDYIGSSVAAGDVNGDGFADLIIGMGPGTYSGSAAYVVFGHGGGFAADFDILTMTPSTGFRLLGSSYDYDGISVAPQAISTATASPT